VTYPATPLEVEVDLNLGGTWVNAATTGDGVLHRAGIRVSHGRANWAGEIDPARLGFVMRNTDGRWSPDHATGPNFPLYRRNIPTRFGIALGDGYMMRTGLSKDLARTSEAPAGGGSALTSDTGGTYSTTSGTSHTITTANLSSPPSVGNKILFVIATVGPAEATWPAFTHPGDHNTPTAGFVLADARGNNFRPAVRLVVVTYDGVTTSWSFGSNTNIRVAAVVLTNAVGLSASAPTVGTTPVTFMPVVNANNAKGLAITVLNFTGGAVTAPPAGHTQILNTPLDVRQINIAKITLGTEGKYQPAAATVGPGAEQATTIAVTINPVAVSSVPCPVLPPVNLTSAVVVNPTDNVAAIVAANPAGTVFDFQPGTYTNASDIRAKNDQVFYGKLGADGLPSVLFNGGAFVYGFRASALGLGDRVRIQGIKLYDYGNTTTDGIAEYGAIQASPRETGTPLFTYDRANAWTVYDCELSQNSSNGIALSDNAIVYRNLTYGHKITGVNGDRYVGGLIHSHTSEGDGVDPSTGIYSNGASIKLTWTNAFEGRTQVVPVGAQRPVSAMKVANTVMRATRSGLTGTGKIGLWYDLGTWNVVATDNVAVGFEYGGFIHEGSNNFVVEGNYAENCDGYGPTNGADFVIGAFTHRESQNGTWLRNYAKDCTYGFYAAQSRRTVDWYKATPVPDDFVNYAWPAGPRYWITATQGPVAPTARASMWTRDCTVERSTFENCNHIAIGEGTDGGGMTTTNSIPLDTIKFRGNHYSGPVVTNGFHQKTVEASGVSLATWQALPYERDNVTLDDGGGLVDLDLRAEFNLWEDLLDIVQPGGNDDFRRVRIAHRSGGADGWQWELYNAFGYVVSNFTWIDIGGAAHDVTTEFTGSFLPHTFQHDRVAFRVTLDVDNGLGGHDVKYWVSTAIGGTWTQVGATVTNSGVTSLKASTAPLRVGGNPNDIFPGAFPGAFHAFELRHAINGPLIAQADFNRASGTTTWDDPQGNTWDLGTGARITNMRYRFHGELASLPVRWDLSGKDKVAPVEAAGLFRRLRQGGDLLESALRRATLRQAQGLVQYWPMEETGDVLTQFGAAVGSSPFLVYQGGSPTLGVVRDFPSSGPLPTVGTTSWATWADSYPTTTQWQVRWLMSVPTTLTTTGTPFFRVYTTTGLIFELHYRSDFGGDIRVDIIKNGVVVYTSGFVAFEAAGKPMRFHLECLTDGVNVAYALEAQSVGGDSAGISATGAALNVEPGAVWHIIVNQDGTMGDTGFGHITLQDVLTPTSELADGLAGYLGERAVARIQRLCQEEGVAYRINGDPFDTERMGVQRPLSLAALLQECADADGGILAEARESVAVSYRTRASMQDQAGLALSYSGGQVAGVPELDRDDQGFANDVSVHTTAGGSGRAVLDDPDNPLSIFQPPQGAGRYAVPFDLNALETRAADLAGWRLRLFTVNEPRVSKLSLETNLPAVVASPTLTQAILALELGDVVDVASLPSATYTGNLRQLIQGTREQVTMFSHRLDLNTTSASPWDIRTVNVDARYDTASSILAAAASQGATSISVATLLGPAWTTAAGDLPLVILVGGQRVTVTAIGAVSGGVQTFTIAPLARALDVGFPVALADPTYFEL
jgi:hypothetical protein